MLCVNRCDSSGVNLLTSIATEYILSHFYETFNAYIDLVSLSSHFYQINARREEERERERRTRKGESWGREGLVGEETFIAGEWDALCL
jgi:hypothetical protein